MGGAKTNCTNNDTALYLRHNYFNREMGLMKIASVLLCLCPVLNAQTLCVEGGVRIVRTSSFGFTGAGRVEVCHNSVWGTIAQPDSLWSEKNAQVACRDAGYMGALNSVFTRSTGLSFGDVAAATTPVHYIVVCDGLETNLLSCVKNDNVAQYRSSATTYIHIDDVFVVCRLNTVYSPAHPAGVQVGDIRLLGDSANGRGAVEIFTNTFQWVTICPDGFDDSDASVLCGRLGYEWGRRSLYSISATSAGQQILYNADCSEDGANVGLVTTRIVAGVCSFSLSLSGCPSQATDLAGVECFSSSESQGSVRLFGGDGSNGVVETLYNGKWGMICDSSFGENAARAVCSQLGFYAPESSYSTASSDLLDRESNLKPIWLSNLVCQDDTSRLSQCSQSGQLVGFALCGSSTSIVAVSCGTQFSGAEIAGIAIGVPAGIIVIAIIAWFAGVNQCWAKRSNNPHYRSLVACWTGCKTRCQETRSARREAREAQRAQREAEQTAQRDERAAEQAAQRTRERARQAEVHVQMEAVAAAQPSAPFPEPVPTKDGEFMKAAPPQYPYAIGFQQVASDLPPPYSEAAAGTTYPPR